jgi:hypothetical protein
MRHLQRWIAALVVGAGAPGWAHSPVNIINSSDSPWLLRIQSNPGGFRIRVEHSLTVSRLEHQFEPGTLGQFWLDPQSVFSIEALGDPGACQVLFHLLDQNLTRPNAGFLTYQAPARQGTRGRLKYHCNAVLRPHVDPSLRQPSPSILHLIGETWRWCELPRGGTALAPDPPDAEAVDAAPNLPDSAGTWRPWASGTSAWTATLPQPSATLKNPYPAVPCPHLEEVYRPHPVADFS